MIEITHHLNSNAIEVSGHAGYDVPGKDIVCAAVSVLTETLIASVLTLSDNEIQVQKDEGYTKIIYDPLAADFSLQVLLRAFLLVFPAWQKPIRITRMSRPWKTEKATGILTGRGVVKLREI